VQRIFVPPTPIVQFVKRNMLVGREKNNQNRAHGSICEKEYVGNQKRRLILPAHHWMIRPRYTAGIEKKSVLIRIVTVPWDNMNQSEGRRIFIRTLYCLWNKESTGGSLSVLSYALLDNDHRQFFGTGYFLKCFFFILGIIIQYSSGPSF
jgi:hypothetical protein